MALGRTAEDLDALYQKLAENASQRGVVGKMSVYHQEVIDGLLTASGRDDAAASLQRLNSGGALGVGTTGFFDAHSFHFAWGSLQELYDTLHGSFHIPFYCAFDGEPCLAWVKGQPVVDGAFSLAGDGLPEPSDTLWFSVSDSEVADIALPLSKEECAFPFEGERYDEVKRIGREAVARWIQQRSEEAAGRQQRGGPKRGTGGGGRRATLATIPKRGLGAPNWLILVPLWAMRAVEWISLRLLKALCRVRWPVAWLLLLSALSALARRRVVLPRLRGVQWPQRASRG